MRSFWSEPFLWIHVAGLAAFPIFIELTWLALAVGVPILPVWLELLLVAVVSIIPVLWMQLTRPFYIFSILAVAMKPPQLSEQQRRILSQFKTGENRLLTAGTAVFMLWLLWQLYYIAPLATSAALWFPQWRLASLIMAGLAFLASNLFLQIPLSVVGVLLTAKSELATTEPYPLELIPQDYTIVGWQVNQILPLEMIEAAKVETPPPEAPTSSNFDQT